MHQNCWLIILLWVLSPAFVFAEIRIFGLNDLNLGRWTLGSGSLQSNANICVAVRPRGPYQVTAFGGGVSNAFQLSNGISEIPYRVFFNDRPRENGAIELVAGSVLGGLRGIPRGIRQNVCRRPSANISIRVEDADLQRATAGQYIGNVLIIVGPE